VTSEEAGKKISLLQIKLNVKGKGEAETRAIFRTMHKATLSALV
jgi:hypothetical protein